MENNAFFQMEISRDRMAPPGANLAILYDRNGYEAGRNECPLSCIQNRTMGLPGS